MEIQELEDKIRYYNENYRKGNSLISDADYDELLEELKEKDPGNELFTVGVIESLREFSGSSDRMEKLPIPMYSLEKYKDVAELKKFIQNNWQLNDDDMIIITPKYDGISLCVKETSHNVWTRGDGSEGQKSDNHFRMIQNGGEAPVRYSFGEAIFPTASFLKNKGEYKSARNCVAGLFNSPDTSSMLQWVRYIRYGSSSEDIDKSAQLDRMSKTAKNVTNYWKTVAANFKNSDLVLRKQLEDLFRQVTEYKCDGLVIEIDRADKRQKLGRLPNGNPRYAVAYKDPEWSERSETITKSIEWNISKDGKAKPVLVIEPVDLCGATVQRASGYNAKYICDNHICEGAVIIIARSGDVIPKHLQTLNYSFEKFKDMMDDMMICPSCGEPLKWDVTQIELVCANEECPQRKISELVYFFDTIGMEEFREPTIKKIYEAGYKTPQEILCIKYRAKLAEIEGIGESLANTIISQFEKLMENGLPLARLMTAYNVFGGVLGEKTCQMIFDNLSKEDLVRIGDFLYVEVSHLTAINGVGEITAEAFNKGTRNYSTLLADPIPIKYIAQEKIKAAENQLSVCFSGFRNSDWESALISKGHKVASGISKKTTHLVVKDKNSSSSKTTKAKELGVPVLDESDFVNLLNTL